MYSEEHIFTNETGKHMMTARRVLQLVACRLNREVGSNGILELDVRAVNHGSQKYCEKTIRIDQQ